MNRKHFNNQNRYLGRTAIPGQTHLKYKNPLIARVSAFFNLAYFFVKILIQQGFQKYRAFALTAIPVALLTLGWILSTPIQRVALAHMSAVPDHFFTESGVSAPSSSQPSGKITPRNTSSERKPDATFPYSIKLSQVELDSNVQGAWGPVIAFPSIPVAAAVLPNGKVVTWASQDPLHYESSSGQLEKTYTTIFNPATNEVQEELVVVSTNHDMFCPGIAMLPDGRLFVNGGGPNSPRTSIFDFRTNQWNKAEEMKYGRWYNTSVTLPNGNVFTLGGDRGNKPPGSDELRDAFPGELWDAFSEKWLELGGTRGNFLLGYDRSYEYPRMFVAPDGNVFASGPTPMMHWLNLSKEGSHQDAGLRGDDDYAQNSVNVMYDQGKILKTGGATKFTGGIPSNTTYVIDINNGANARKVDPMKNARAFANGVVLPNGKVMVVGGNTSAIEFSDDGSNLTPELWDPATEQWTDLANHSVPRNYHSVALLLPDGRVFAAGGGLCGERCSTNHPNAEIFTPPYLFDSSGEPAPRPVISLVPGEIGYNWTFSVNMENDMPIEKFNLIRLSSVTHSTNTDQRFLSLPFTAEESNSYSLQAPENANIAPPGYYMLFALNQQGVPSVGQIIQIN